MAEKTILLANRNRDSLTITREFLERKGLATIAAFTIDQVLQHCRLYPQQLHLAILDLRLQDETDERDVSGLELAKRLRRQEMIPAIILTLYDEATQQQFRLATELDHISSIVLVPRQAGLAALYDVVVSLLI